MLEKIPGVVGRALNKVRAGAADLAVVHTEITGVNATIDVGSTAFGYNDSIPSRYTADGPGLSPPLEWNGVPPTAAAVVLLVEDADSPTPHPLVHALVWDLPGTNGFLPEGALRDESKESRVRSTGRNSYLSTSYLPPDPPPGHGPHRYVFQIFAIDQRLGFNSPPGRHALLDALQGHVIAKGMLIGTYERGRP
jgi:Raf kinase inhibitor-like YbhB/YbcL family protein